MLRCACGSPSLRKPSRTCTQHLNTARSFIDTALGVVMGQNHCDHDTAFNILRRAASSRNLKLRDLAASVVESVSGDTYIVVHFDP